MNNGSKNTHANVSFILGFCAIVAWIIPLVGFPVTIVGIILGIKGQQSELAKKAQIGLTMNIIFLVITAINSAYGMFMGLGYY